MEALTTLDILYICLSIFVSVIGILLAFVLYRIVRILAPVQDLASKYYDVKHYISQFQQVPEKIQQKLLDIIEK